MRAFLGLMILAAVTVFDMVTAVTYNVGGTNGGWDSTTNLQAWALSQTFVVGDKLAFQYAPMHDVVEVTKPDYDSCQTTNVIQSYTGGATIVPLSSPGNKYFICGTPGHCTQGMKLQIDTLAAASALLPPPPPPAALVPSSLPQNDDVLFPNSPAPAPASGGALSPEGLFPPTARNSLPDLSPSSAARKAVNIAGFGMVSLVMLLAVTRI